MIFFRPLRNQKKSRCRSGKYQYARVDSTVGKHLNKRVTTSLARTKGSTPFGSTRAYSRTRTKGHVFRLSRESSKLP